MDTRRLWQRMGWTGIEEVRSSSRVQEGVPPRSSYEDESCSSNQYAFMDLHAMPRSLVLQSESERCEAGEICFAISVHRCCLEQGVFGER